MMTKGGPRRTTDVVLYHIYKEAWQKFEVGTASAMSYVLFAMILVARSLLGFRGRKSAYLTITGFALGILTVIGMTL